MFRLRGPTHFVRWTASLNMTGILDRFALDRFGRGACVSNAGRRHSLKSPLLAERARSGAPIMARAPSGSVKAGKLRLTSYIAELS